jgi:Zn2+/Cd2+-exporting ATPase
MNGKQKKMLLRIILSSLIYMVLLILKNIGVLDILSVWIEFILFLIPYLLVGYDIILKAFRNICHGQVFDENFLMMLATFGALGVHEFSEATAVMLFYQIGELFQAVAVGKSRKSISDMMNICPEYANIEINDEVRKVDPGDVEIGSILVIKPGERIPLDSTVVEGESFIDTKALTGEPVPRRAVPGDMVISGCVNGEGTLKVKTVKVYEDSTVSKILELVENASSKKAKTEQFITKFAKYYTPAVTIGAAVLAFLPPVLGAGSFGTWLQRACIFLVISCPCALVISVPLGFFGGIGAASRIGVLVKGSNYFETIAQMKNVVFDKTGTLTKGEFKVTQINPDNCSKEDLLETAALAEMYSTHPIAKSIIAAYGRMPDASRTEQTKEIAGHGISIKIDGKEVLAGNAALLKDSNVAFTESDVPGTAVYLAEDGKFKGTIVISDTVKDCAGQAIISLKKAGVKKTVMLTGDREETAAQISSKLGIDEHYSGLLPEDKVLKLEKIISDEGENEKTAFVGDGINDAPVLTRADIGVAMGSMGSDAAIEAADVVIMDDDLNRLSAIKGIAVKTIHIVKENIWFALAVKALVLVLGAFGVANMWEAVFADVGVSVIAILNSMRTLKLTHIES